jgi:molecular chaperone HscB
MICWRCHEPTQGPVCVGCGAIQPPPATPDHFAILGMERRFHVEPKEVNQAFRKVSRKVHPDRFAGKSAVERRMSLQWTASVNQAARVLKDDEQRARYLATGNHMPPERGGADVDPDFMEEIFELQMEARMDPEAVQPQVEKLHADTRAVISDIFAAWEAGEGNLDAIEGILARLRYIETARNLH